MLALSLVGCGRVLDFRDDYYVAAGSNGLGLGGDIDAAGSSSRGGATSDTGGSASDTGGDGGGGKPSEVGGDGSVGGRALEPSAGDAGGGSSSVEDAGAGSAGAPAVPHCADNPITAEATWVPTASPVDKQYPASAVIDGTSARWTTGVPQAGGEWLQIDFGKVVGVRRINLQQGMTYSNDYPRGYQVIVSDTSQNLKGPVATTGVGMSGVTTTIVLPQVYVGRYLLIEQLDSSLSWWSVEEIEISCFDS